MTFASNYSPLIAANLRQAFEAGPDLLARRLPAVDDGRGLVFPAFGGHCRLTPGAVNLQGQPETGPRGVILSLYAKSASDAVPAADPRSGPWIAFGELPHSRPYVGAFASHCEAPLVPHVGQIMARQAEICNAFHGAPLSGPMGGDLMLRLAPLPKVQLAYVFYRADEDFPASVKCLFAKDAHRFLPVDGLADVGEYTSQVMISLLA